MKGIDTESRDRERNACCTSSETRQLSSSGAEEAMKNFRSQAAGLEPVGHYLRRPDQAVHAREAMANAL